MRRLFRATLFALALLVLHALPSIAQEPRLVSRGQCHWRVLADTVELSQHQQQHTALNAMQDALAAFPGAAVWTWHDCVIDFVVAADTTPPDTFAIAAAAENGAVRVTWNDHVPDDIVGLAPVRSLTGEPVSFANLISGNLPPSTREYIDESVLAGATYYYRLRWRHEDNTYSASAIASVTVPADTTVEPPDTSSGQPVAASVAGGQHVLLVGDTVTIRPNLVDEDDAIVPTEPSEWSVDFDAARVSVSSQFRVTALAPTPAASSTTITYLHGGTQLEAAADIVILSEPPDPPEGWPDNEPAGMAPVLAVDGSSKDWPGYRQSSEWAGDRVRVVVDPASKYGHAIEKRFFTGETGGWHGIIHQTPPQFGLYDELYFRLVFRLSDNWQWHSGGGKYLYYGHSAGATGWIIGWTGNGTIRWIDGGSGAGEWRPGNLPVVSRGEYHTIEVHHVSNAGGQPGSLRLWLDGIEATTFTLTGGGGEQSDLKNRTWVLTENLTDKRIGGLQAWMYWGGSGAPTKPADDWIRLSELYISGRN